MRISNIIKSLLFVMYALNLYAQSDLFSYNDSLAQPKQSNSNFIKIIDSSNNKSVNSYLSNISNYKEVVLDNYIDSTKYIVGPGDVFVISLWGIEKKQIAITISPEGFFSMPMIGSVFVCKLPLNKAKEQILNKINELYKSTYISVDLQHLRHFKTYINGEVKKQGSVIVDGNTRVSDIIALAGGILDGGKHRGIIIKNELDTNVRLVDLKLAENASDYKMNPYISESDRIYVPPRKEVIYINGSISYPDHYDFIPGDNVLHLIKLAGGFLRDADTNSILLYKYCNSTDSIEIVRLNYLEASECMLNPDDRVFVQTLPDYRKSISVIVKGEVFLPGEYPIVKNKTRLSEIIKLSGGFKPSADIRAAKLIRNKYKYPGEYQFSRIKKIPPKVQYPYEQDYYLTKSTEGKPVVNIDFNNIVEKSESDVFLEQNDTIEIPEKSFSVKIIGAVVRPGIVSVSKNRHIGYYIEQCGGFSKNAKEKSIRIIKNNNETISPSKVKDIEAGDVIWVPEKRYVDRVEVTKDWVLFVSAIATTLLAFFALQDYVK